MKTMQFFENNNCYLKSLLHLTSFVVKTYEIRLKFKQIFLELCFQIQDTSCQLTTTRTRRCPYCLVQKSAFFLNKRKKLDC